MFMGWAKVSRIIFVIVGLLAAAGDLPAGETERYDRRFFVQLRTVFGRFRNTDLDRAFDKAQSIQCSELVNEEAEWRTVAFFNEKRELGDWYRKSLEEVKNDPSVFVFKGVCRSEHGPVQLTTKFPVTETVEAYSQRRIGFDEIAVNTNAPVRAVFDSETQAYRFDLPYLFLVSRQDDQSIYSLNPPELAERYRYATDVINHWDCKSVTAENVTYQFLICRTTTLPRIPAQRSQSRSVFGASAYFILSDGKEASSSVKLSFDDADNAKHIVEDAGATTLVSDLDSRHGPDSAAWEVPDSDEKLLDITRDEFRIRFSAQSWTGRIGAIQVLSAKRISSVESPSPAPGVDYCIWSPGGTAAAEQLLAANSYERVTYTLTPHDQDARSPTSIIFNFNALAGGHLGRLECVFPRASSAAGISFDRWVSIVGDHLALEVRP